MSTEFPPFPRFRAKVLGQAVIEGESCAVISNLLGDRAAVRVSCKYKGRKVCVVVAVANEEVAQFDRQGVVGGTVGDAILEAVRRASAVQKRSRG